MSTVVINPRHFSEDIKMQFSSYYRRNSKKSAPRLVPVRGDDDDDTENREIARERILAAKLTGGW